MSETFECPTCGYRWQQGQHGGHLCSDRLLQQLKDAKIELNSVLVDWNAIVSASGSKTHGGAVGHVAQMRAELEAVKAELITLKRYLAQRKQEFDWAISANAELVALKTELYAMPPMPAQQYSEYPMQPIIDGRFEANPIVDMLVDKVGLNEISVWWQTNEIPIKYTEQLAQLIGYSIGGYSELDYVSDESYGRAVKLSELQNG